MVRTAEEKHLLERLADGDFDGPVGDDFVTGSYRKVYHWKSIIEGVPVLIREGESTRFFNGKENETISGKRTEELIDSLQSDLARVTGRAEKQQSIPSEIKDVEKLRAERDQAATNLAAGEEELKQLRAERDKTAQKIEAKRQEYSAKGGDIYAQRQQLYSKRVSIISRIESLEEHLIADAASELPLSLVRNLLQSAYQKAEAEHEQKLLSSTLTKLEALFGEYKDTDPSERATISKFIDYVRGTARPDSKYKFDALSDSSISKLKVLLDSQLTSNRNDIQQRKIELADLKKQKDQLDNYLSVEIDEKTITNLYREIKELEQKEISLDVKICNKEDECRTLNGKSMAAGSAFKKSLESFIKKVEFNDDSERILKYAHMASAILDEYTLSLQKRKVSAVAETMTKCYKSLANKTSLIERIEMDPVTLDLHYINPEGKDVSRASLSAGEKQLMVISLLWALAICSKQKLPVIIDTPLSRLDSAHRSSVIHTYFPQASEQTIILSTDTEIDQSYYEMMKPDIGDEFTLIYDDDSKSTSICRGYFPGV